MNDVELSVPNTAMSWQKVKGELISRYGSVRAVAARLDCHPNSLRAAVEGFCPGVRIRLDALLASRERGNIAEISHSAAA